MLPLQPSLASVVKELDSRRQYQRFFLRLFLLAMVLTLSYAQLNSLSSAPIDIAAADVLTSSPFDAPSALTPRATRSDIAAWVSSRILSLEPGAGGRGGGGGLFDAREVARLGL
jgi:hypothetical protein